VVTERRDPARDAASPSASSPAGAGSRPPGAFARLVGRRAGPPSRRLVVGRLVVGLLVGVAAAALVVGGGMRAIQSALGWLRLRPEYQIEFASIHLDPPPPRWVRTGAAGLLERVRTRGGYDETMPLLGLDLEALGKAFARESPWVRSVDRIERGGDNRLTVALSYREPVALVRLGARPRQTTLVLDGDGVVLPSDDLDLASAGPLIALEDLVRPGPAGTAPMVAAETRPGRALRLAPPPGDGPDPAVLEAASLAAELKRRGAADGPPKAPVKVTAVKGHALGWFLVTAEPALILWGPAPGREPAGEPDADRKWALLTDWLEQNQLRSLSYPSYLAFGRDRAFVKDPTAPRR
jgi:hypothetical protein